MFFGKSKKRKSNVVGTPEYNEYEEQDNRQDIYDLQERMKKYGFEGGPGTNKDRWIYGDNVFDFDRPFGGAQEAWTISEDNYNKLKDLLDKLDSEKDADVAQEAALSVADKQKLFDELQQQYNNYKKFLSSIKDTKNIPIDTANNILMSYESMLDTLTDEISKGDTQDINEANNLISKYQGTQDALKDMKLQLDVGNEEDAKNQTVNNIVKGLKFGQYDK